MLQKILISIGDSTGSEEILEVGLTLAEKHQAQALLVHVLNPLAPYGFEVVTNPLVGRILPIAEFYQTKLKPSALSLER